LICEKIRRNPVATPIFFVAGMHSDGVFLEISFSIFGCDLDRNLFVHAEKGSRPLFALRVHNAVSRGFVAGLFVCLTCNQNSISGFDEFITCIFNRFKTKTPTFNSGIFDNKLHHYNFSPVVA